MTHLSAHDPIIAMKAAMTALGDTDEAVESALGIILAASFTAPTTAAGARAALDMALELLIPMADDPDAHPNLRAVRRLVQGATEALDRQ